MFFLQGGYGTVNLRTTPFTTAPPETTYDDATKTFTVTGFDWEEADRANREALIDFLGFTPQSITFGAYIMDTGRCGISIMVTPTDPTTATTFTLKSGDVVDLQFEIVPPSNPNASVLVGPDATANALSCELAKLEESIYYKSTSIDLGSFHERVMDADIPESMRAGLLRRIEMAREWMRHLFTN